MSDFRRIRKRGRSGVFTLAFAFSLIPPLCVGCGTGSIGGTYVSHGQNFATMLQLTQAKTGQIAGVITSVELTADGRLNSNNVSVTGGAVDGDQITLTIRPGVFARNISGTKAGSIIRLNTVRSDGTFLTGEFQRASANDFETYANYLRERARAVALNAELLKRAQETRLFIQSMDQWTSNADLHAQRISNAKNAYESIEGKMQSLVARERSMRSSVARSQIAVEVSQYNLAGGQTDIALDQIWDQSIEASGAALRKNQPDFNLSCYGAENLKENGAPLGATDSWKNVCKELSAESEKFEVSYDRIMKQKADLKAFEARARLRRNALVEEANRVQ
jgi:hypothetical protein